MEFALLALITLAALGVAGVITRVCRSRSDLLCHQVSSIASFIDSFDSSNADHFGRWAHPILCSHRHSLIEKRFMCQ